MRPEAHIKRELNIMAMLRNQTYNDLNFFVTQREKRPWRNWDKKGFYYKPEITPATLSLNQLIYLVDLNLVMVQIIEDKFN